MTNSQTCPRCEKEVYAEARFDARGIYITRCCDECWAEVKKGYREDVLSNPNYECDEPIDEE